MQLELILTFMLMLALLPLSAPPQQPLLSDIHTTMGVDSEPLAPKNGRPNSPITAFTTLSSVSMPE